MTISFKSPKTAQSRRGFTLIEVMIAVVVVAIMAAIAYPNLLIYVTKSRVKAGMQFLQQVSVAQERFLTTRRSYATNIADLGISEVPKNVQNDFNPVKIVVSIPADTNAIDPTLANQKPSYVAVLTPRATGRLSAQYAIAINAEGDKWMESDNNCNTPAASGAAQESAWPGRCCGTTDGVCPAAGATPSSDPNKFTLGRMTEIRSCRDRSWGDWERVPQANRISGGCTP